MKTLQLSEQEIQIVGHALGALPYAQVYEMIAKINAQLMTQSRSSEGVNNTASDSDGGTTSGGAS